MLECARLSAKLIRSARCPSGFDDLEVLFEGALGLRMRGVEVADEVGSVFDIDGTDLGEFFVGAFVAKPAYAEAKRTGAEATIDLRGENFGDFELDFVVDNYRRRWILLATRESVGNMRFELRDVENWMYFSKVVGELYREGLRTGLSEDLEGTEKTRSEFTSGLSGLDVLGVDEDEVVDLEVRRWSSAFVRGFGIPILSVSDLLFERGLQLKDVNGEVAGATGRDVALGENRDDGVVTLVGEERRNAGRVVRGVVVREFGERKKFGPVVLLIGAVDAKVLLEGLVDALDLTVRFGVVTRSVVHLHVEERAERSKETRNEFGTAVGRDVTGRAMLGEDVDEEETSEFFRGDFVGRRDEDALFREAINNDEDRSTVDSVLTHTFLTHTLQ